VSQGRLTDRRQRRRQRALFIALAVALVAYGLVSGDHKPYHLALLWLEEQRTGEQITELDAQRRVLDREKARLESDTLALEALAREKGMIRPGDVVYRIVPVPPGVREAAAESLAVRAAREAAARAADSLRLETSRARRLAADSDRLDAPPLED
jgi:cell division protein FtsB